MWYAIWWLFCLHTKWGKGWHYGHNCFLYKLIHFSCVLRFDTSWQLVHSIGSKYMVSNFYYLFTGSWICQWASCQYKSVEKSNCLAGSFHRFWAKCECCRHFYSLWGLCQNADNFYPTPCRWGQSPNFVHMFWNPNYTSIKIHFMVQTAEFFFCALHVLWSSCTCSSRRSCQW